MKKITVVHIYPLDCFNMYIYIHIHTYIESLESNVNMASVRDDWEKNNCVQAFSGVVVFKGNTLRSLRRPMICRRFFSTTKSEP